MAKQASLFSFFTQSSNKCVAESTSKEKSRKIGRGPTVHGKEISMLDLVWAKLEGYPWWPAIVSDDPKENKCYKNKSIHVQFFEDPPSRAWIKEGSIKPYGSPLKYGIPLSKDLEWLDAKASADSVASLSKEDRRSFIVETVPSTDDDERDSDEFDDDSDKSKENMDVNVNGGRKRLGNGKTSESKSKKRRIILSDSEQSGDEYKPEKADESEEEEYSGSSGVDEISITDTESDIGSPIKTPPKHTKSNVENSRVKSNVTFSPSIESTSKFSPRLLETTKSKLAEFSAKVTPNKSKERKEDDWPHTKLPWLKRDGIRDAERRSPDHPEYDPRTFHVPEDFLNKQTPGMRQWWDLKRQHFDTILFFKMGKFYELFHTDAILSIQELGLVMMKGETAHTGFPEIAYGRYSSLLIEKGFKVARVEQTETPDMMEKRCKQTLNPTKFDKVVRRELCQVSSLATRILSVMDGDASDPVNSCYLLAISEKVLDGPGDNCKLGVAFIDTTIGKFHIGQFVDDRHLSRLRTLVAHYPPAQILMERGRFSQKLKQFVKTVISPGLLELLTPEKEFWNATKTYSVLSESKCFTVDGQTVWPEPLKETFDCRDAFELQAHERYELGVSSLGALVWYLTLCKLEEDLLTRRNFTLYSAPDVISQDLKEGDAVAVKMKHMILDGTTLKNLEIFENSTGSCQGTLFETLNYCKTAFGKRLLRCWISSPMYGKASIETRLDAIEDFRGNQDLVATVQELLKTLPDLEKLLSKIHSQGLKRSPSHPDTRAILFENQQYSQRKVQDFLSCVSGFKIVLSVINAFKDVRKSLKSQLLRNCITLKEDGGKFPALEHILRFFDNAFDHCLARKEGKIIPSEGVDEEYDAAIKVINSTKEELEQYLKEQCKYFSAKVVYWGSDKKRYQLEVPDSAAKRLDDRYELVSQKKGCKRYWTETTKSLLSKMSTAEENKENALQDIARRIFAQFDEHTKEWSSALECISVVDVLLSLTTYSYQVESVRPSVEAPSVDTKPFIKIREGRHPCSIKIFSGGDYIPNDTIIGSVQDDSHTHLVLVTGPNMGGKSTLMRQTALICIMAQIGSYVPASECTLTAIDRVFTRLGAWDRIYQGESTFYVELAETAAIINHATLHSLVIVDELGRGTATYDGTAIACSVVDALIKIGCRTLFSTHYHSLVDEFKIVKGVSLGHMACMVEGENEDDPSQETITFLYKFAKGACPKSYGFNAARLADVPEQVIRSGSYKAKHLEKINGQRKLFYSLFAEASRYHQTIKDVVLAIRNII